jgi:KaiC/GvpD/RAD55 family RecA-like ATPase
VTAEDDFGGPAPSTPAPSNVIPFGRMKVAPGPVSAWEREIVASNNKLQTSHKFISPIDALADMERQRHLPTLPYPAAWNDFARRCLLYAGEMIGVSGPTGGGKTQFAIEVGCAAAGDGTPVLWLPLELDPPQVNLRIVANRAGRHTAAIRNTWSMEDQARVLMSVADKWRYVDKVRGVAAQITALRAAIQIAKRIYGRPPLWVMDYVGKLARGSTRDARLELADGIEELRQMTIDEECFGMVLSQTSRGNNAVLTGKIDLDSASDAIGTSAETSELEHACSVMVGLNVFKTDDAEELDAHWLITKARGTGQEGRVGSRFIKAGGQWRELEYLPATPGEVSTEVKKAKKDKNRIDPPDAKTTRTDLNFARAAKANAERRDALVHALRHAGMFGAGTTALRKVRGCGNLRKMRESLDELVKAGTVEQMTDARWRLAP